MRRTTRRGFLRMTGQLAAAGALTRLAWAEAVGDARFVVVLLRGGLDGLHAVPPYADPDYRRLRPRLAIAAPGTPRGALDLDGSFGLHPALAPLEALFRNRELLIVPAAATRYRNRSHFDARNVLETGSGTPFGRADGWLNRALTHLGPRGRRLGLALGPSVPLILQGRAEVATWADSPLPEVDEDFLARVAELYAGDPLFATALAEAEGGIDLDMPRRSRRRVDLPAAAEITAKLLARSDGPRVAVIESNGWDTHFGQTRRLDRQLEQLAKALTALRDGLGGSWQHSVVWVVSEFGRTAAENGTGGTDHGVGGVALILGGNVAGGRLVGRWPGLAPGALYQGRDVRPTTAYESLAKALLLEHLGISEAHVEESVFPDSRTLAATGGLLRSA